MMKRRNKAVKLFAFFAVVFVLLSVLSVSVFAEQYTDSFEESGYGTGDFVQFVPDGSYPQPNDFVNNLLSGVGYNYIFVIPLSDYMSESGGVDFDCTFYSFDTQEYRGYEYNEIRITCDDTLSCLVYCSYNGTFVSAEYLDFTGNPNAIIWVGFDHYTNRGDVWATNYWRRIYNVPQAIQANTFGTWNYNDGYIAGVDYAGNQSYNTAYQQGRTDGYAEGNTYGYANGYRDGLQAGDGTFSAGYEAGFSAGTVSAVDNTTSWNNFFFSAVNAPVRVFRSLLDVKVFGISVFGIVSSLLVIALIVIIVKAVV